MTTKEHHVLLLNAPFTPPHLSFPHTLTHLHNTTPSDILPALSTATIIVTAAVRLTTDLILHHAPALQCIVCMGTGVDNIDAEACRARGIVLCNTPAQNVASVAEHAFALLGALKRKIVQMHAVVLDGATWPARKLMIGDWAEPPRTNGDEVLGVVGYGALGKGVERLAMALGMRVLVAERKGAAEVREGRVAFESVLREATVVVMTAPLDDTTRGMIGAAELKIMRKGAFLVNVGRGGLVDEAALAQALKNGEIGGAATDVFAQEPATKETCPLLDPAISNLVLSPHVAWFSATTINGAKKVVHANIEAFVAGEPQNVIIPGRS